MMTTIGILHPGEMGISIAASAINNGHQVYWFSQGRSKETQARAAKYNLVKIDSLIQFCQACEAIISVCPPHAAEDIARSVISAEFKGLFLDANAISPQHTIRIGRLMEPHTVQFVDGGIIGGPAWAPNGTWLYLSGEHAKEFASFFSKGPLGVKVIGSDIGKASALKMCYAAYSKGTMALLSATLAAAASLGVEEELNQQWDTDNNGFSEQVNQSVRRVTAKAWRFEGEMKEIASTFQEAGLPEEFHQAAADIYHRIAHFKDSTDTPALRDVLNALLAH